MVPNTKPKTARQTQAEMTDDLDSFVLNWLLAAHERDKKKKGGDAVAQLWDIRG